MHACHCAWCSNCMQGFWVGPHLWSEEQWLLIRNNCTVPNFQTFVRQCFLTHAGCMNDDQIKEIRILFKHCWGGFKQCALVKRACILYYCSDCTLYRTLALAPLHGRFCCCCCCVCCCNLYNLDDTHTHCFIKYLTRYIVLRALNVKN